MLVCVCLVCALHKQRTPISMRYKYFKNTNFIYKAKK